MDVRGCRIAVRETGGAGPPLVLVHGGSGHSHWWDDVLPHLGDHRVLLPDLSGHGDSGRRPDYRLDLWAAEIAAVARAAGTDATVVGHSMGGRMALLAAARDPEAIGRIVLVDSAVPLLPREAFPRVRPRREYPDEAAALAGFHLMPREPEDAATVARVAAHSVVRDGDVWTFKFDPAIFARLLDQEPEEALPDVRCPVTAVNGAESTITSAEMTAALAAGLGRPVPATAIAGAHHHVPLSHPAALAALLR